MDARAFDRIAFAMRTAYCTFHDRTQCGCRHPQAANCNDYESQYYAMITQASRWKTRLDANGRRYGGDYAEVPVHVIHSLGLQFSPIKELLYLLVWSLVLPLHCLFNSNSTKSLIRAGAMTRHIIALSAILSLVCAAPAALPVEQPAILQRRHQGQPDKRQAEESDAAPHWGLDVATAMAVGPPGSTLR